MAERSNETELDDGVKCARGRNTQQPANALFRQLARKDQDRFMLVTIEYNTNTKAYLARKDQEVEIGARSEARVLYILNDKISARARTM